MIIRKQYRLLSIAYLSSLTIGPSKCGNPQINYMIDSSSSTFFCQIIKGEMKLNISLLCRKIKTVFKFADNCQQNKIIDIHNIQSQKNQKMTHQYECFSLNLKQNKFLCQRDIVLCFFINKKIYSPQITEYQRGIMHQIIMRIIKEPNYVC